MLVVAIHCDHWPYQSSGAAQVFWATLDLLLRVSVPLFIMLSGFLLSYGDQRGLPFGEFLRRRLGRSLLPWVVWLPLYTVVGLVVTGEVGRSPAGVLAWWALGGGHLWYLLLIPQFYLLFQIWPRSSRGLWVAAVAGMVVQLVLCGYRLWAPQTAPLNSLFLAHGYQLCFFWIGYFALGTALGRWWARSGGIRSAGGVIAISAALVVAGAVLVVLSVSRGPDATYGQGTGAFLLPTLVPMVVGAWYVVLLLGDRLLPGRSRLTEAVAALSRYSLGIYIVHEALTYLTGPLQYLTVVRATLAGEVGVFAFQVVFTLLLSYAVVRLLVATPLAFTLGLPSDRLRWKEWRQPFAV